MKYLIIPVITLLSSTALADDPPCPPPYAICLKPEDKKKVTDAVKELDQIKSSEAKIKFKDPILIVEDWDGRVYINGGDKKPIQMNMTVGTLDRDLNVTLPIQVDYRPKPPDPMFRLRVRAQVGLLVPEIIRSVRDKSLDPFWDAGLGWDFFHIDMFNVSAYTGIRSLGGGPGIDITKNFGVYAGYALVYDTWKSSILTSAYFSFN